MRDLCVAILFFFSFFCGTHCSCGDILQVPSGRESILGLTVRITVRVRLELGFGLRLGIMYICKP